MDHKSDLALLLDEMDISLLAAHAADKVAAAHAFTDFRMRASKNTLRSHDNDLARFAIFLSHANIYPPLPEDDELRSRQLNAWVSILNSTGDAWTNVSHGIVKAFIRWMLEDSYSISTINRTLSTIKKYASLAVEADQMSIDAYAKIKLITGYGKKQAGRINDRREDAGLQTRVGHKKENRTEIPDALFDDLKTLHTQDAQGRRDAVMMCILLDLGLRCGELASLTVSSINIDAGTITFYREKVSKTQTHEMTRDVLSALRAYIDFGDISDNPQDPLLRSSLKSGKLADVGMSNQAITSRVKLLGKRHGLKKLSAHDCRHAWATRAARAGTDPFALQEAGGWSSLAMPRRYVDEAKIANQGVMLNKKPVQ